MNAIPRTPSFKYPDLDPCDPSLQLKNLRRARTVSDREIFFLQKTIPRLSGEAKQKATQQLARAWIQHDEIMRRWEGM